VLDHDQKIFVEVRNRFNLILDEFPPVLNPNQAANPPANLQAQTSTQNQFKFFTKHHAKHHKNSCKHETFSQTFEIDKQTIKRDQNEKPARKKSFH
jgi:hypothetical protein